MYKKKKKGKKNYVTFTKRYPKYLPNAIPQTAVIITIFKNIISIELNISVVAYLEMHSCLTHCLRLFVLTTHSLSSSDLKTSRRIKGEELIGGSLCLWMFDWLTVLPNSQQAWSHYVQSSRTVGGGDTDNGLTDPEAGHGAYSVNHGLNTSSQQS